MKLFSDVFLGIFSDHSFFLRPIVKFGAGVKSQRIKR